MIPAVVALLGGGAAIGYIPVFRSQVRRGDITVPIGGINPLHIRRSDTPRLFRLAVSAWGLALVVLVSVCTVVLVRTIPT